jgi:hypothetical protein
MHRSAAWSGILGPLTVILLPCTALMNPGPFHYYVSQSLPMQHTCSVHLQCAAQVRRMVGDVARELAELAEVSASQGLPLDPGAVQAVHEVGQNQAHLLQQVT